MVKIIKIVLDNHEPCHYIPGSVVSGSLVVQVDKPKKYKLIQVDLIGRANVHWTEERFSGEHRHTVHFRNSQTYIAVSSILWRKEDTPNGELQPGVHAWPFQFTLPQNIPPSFEGKYSIGWIRYILRGRIQNCGFWKLDRTTSVAITVKQLPTITIESAPRHRRFGKEKIVKFMFGTPQSIKFAFPLSKTTFSTGETIPLSVTVNNRSSRRVRLVASLLRVETYRAPGGLRCEYKKISRISSNQIEKRQLSTDWDTVIFILEKLPPTIKNCSCISVEYRLNVKLKVPWARNAAISVPIVIHSGQASRNQDIQPRVSEAVPTQQYSFAPPTQQYPRAQQYGMVDVSTVSYHSSSTAPLYRHSQQPLQDPQLDRQQYGLTVSSPPQYEDVASSAWGWEYDRPPSYNETETLLPL